MQLTAICCIMRRNEADRNGRRASGSMAPWISRGCSIPDRQHGGTSIRNRSMPVIGSELGVSIELLQRFIEIGTAPKSKAANPDGIADTPCWISGFNESHSPRAFQNTEVASRHIPYPSQVGFWS